MNTDKAYLLGLIVGGGHIGSNSLTISMPFRKWGEAGLNPARAGRLAKDILTKVQPVFRNEYEIDVYYRTAPNWRIYAPKITDRFKDDLKKFNLPEGGDIRSTADIKKLLSVMNKEAKRYFIAGLADSIGSLAPTHRRFVDEYQIVSLEFKGKNFELVANLIKTLKEIGCIPDQILWNHPNQHSGTDKYYKQWKKGFKIRVTLDDYVRNGSFVFSAKNESAADNIRLQKGKINIGKAASKKIIITTPTTVHIDQNSEWLPANIRGYHFIHNQHLAAALRCNTVPKKEILTKLKKVHYLINPFTILTKGTAKYISDIIRQDELMNNRSYAQKQLNMDVLIRLYSQKPTKLLYGQNKTNGYPVNEILRGCAYVLGATKKTGIKGKRILGNFIELIQKLKNDKVARKMKILLPDLLTPLILTNGKYSVMVGPVNPQVYKKLIKKTDELLYKVRPVSERHLTKSYDKKPRTKPRTRRNLVL